MTTNTRMIESVVTYDLPKRGDFTKVTNFTTSIQRILTRFDSTVIKRRIGDSIENNRVITVRQLIRFLNRSSSTKYRALGRRLSDAYEVVRSDLRRERLYASSDRTDAYDVNEFLSSVNLTVVTGNVRKLVDSIS